MIQIRQSHLRCFFLYVSLLLTSISSITAQEIEKSESAKQAEDYLIQAYSYIPTDLEKSLFFYTKAVNFIDDEYHRACILDTIGLFNWQLGNFDTALNYFKSSVKHFEAIQDSFWLGKLYNNIAVVNWGQGNSNEALKFYQRALSIREKLGDTRGVTNILNNIGLIYQNWELFNEALEWHNKALTKAKSINNLNAIAYSYSNIGMCFDEKNELDTALTLHKTAYDVLLKANNRHRSESYFLVNIGGVFEEMEQLDSALYYYQSSLYHAKRIKNKNRITVSQFHLGKTYSAFNELDSAQFYLDASLLCATKYRYNLLKKDNLFALSELEYKKGNTTSAYQYLKHGTALKDSIFNERTVKTFNELQIKYDIQQKAKENILLKNDIKIHQLKIERQRITAIISFSLGGIILLITLFLLKSRRSLKKLSKQLQNSEIELKELNANKDKFFSIISHDLKTPFNAIIGTSKLLATEIDQLEADKVKELANIQHMASQNAFNLLDSLLKWSRIQMGRIKLKKEPFDLFALSYETIGPLKALANAKSLHINNDIKENTTAFADRKATATVMRNLVNNAIKFTENGGQINLKAFEQNGDMHVSISDTGIGMTEDVRKQLFRLDRENSNKGTNNESGTGLGLIICKELLERQGGKIEVESEPQKGTTFTFSLPRE